MISPAQFEKTRELALQLAGIALYDRHRGLLLHRAQRLGLVCREEMGALLRAAERGEPTAVERMVGLLTTNFTSFFRHPTHFELAAEHALRVAADGGVVHLWSAAAATGEEPYSLAMALIERFGRPDPPVRIWGTDIDATALATARRGVYPERALRGLDAARRDRFFRPQAGGWGVTPAVRRLVEFHALNLVAATWPVSEAFAVIFCRNVLMYLESGRRPDVIARLAARLTPDGLLIIDPTEHLGAAGAGFGAGRNGVYPRWTPGARAVVTS